MPSGADKQDTRHSWHKQLVSYMSDGVLGPSFGPVAATVGSILDLGWKPVSPDFWVIDSTTSVTLDQQPSTRMQLIAKATEDMHKQVWKAAAKHEHGSGLELGVPSFVAAKKAIAY